LEAWIAAREETASALAIFDNASVNTDDSRGGSPEFFFGEPDEDDI
jgi:hypothetical protein